MDIKRDGPPRVTLKNARVCVVGWNLTDFPDDAWRQLFLNQEAFDSSHRPDLVHFVGKMAQVSTIETHIESWVNWFDRWAESTNTRHAQYEADRRQRSQKRLADQQREREELEALNQKLKDKFS